MSSDFREIWLLVFLNIIVDEFYDHIRNLRIFSQLNREYIHVPKKTCLAFLSVRQQNVTRAHLMRQQWNALIFLLEIVLDELYRLEYFTISPRVKSKSLLVKNQFFALFTIKDGNELVMKSAVLKNYIYSTWFYRIRAPLFTGILFLRSRDEFQRHFRVIYDGEI